MCFHVCLLKPGISGYSAGTNCRESARALFNIIVWIDVNWLRYRAVQHRFFCYWRKRYSSRALLAETATDMVCDNLAFTWNVKHLKLTLNLFYRCHIAQYTTMSVQGITEKKWRSGISTTSVLCTCKSANTRIIKSAFMLFVRQSLIIVWVAIQDSLSPPFG